MNASRFNSIYRGLTATARNVYEAIEIDDQGAAREKETTKLKQLQQLLKELA